MFDLHCRGERRVKARHCPIRFHLTSDAKMVFILKERYGVAPEGGKGLTSLSSNNEGIAAFLARSQAASSAVYYNLEGSGDAYREGCPTHFRRLQAEVKPECGYRPPVGYLAADFA